MFNKSYAERAFIFRQKAESESASANVIPRIAAEYFGKAAQFYLMDQDELLAAASYEHAAHWYLEDGDVEECCLHLGRAARCLVRFYKIEYHADVARLFQQVAKLREDSKKYGDCADLKEGLAVYFENIKHYESAHLLYLEASNIFIKGTGRVYSAERCEKKAKEMLDLFNEKK